MRKSGLLVKQAIARQETINAACRIEKQYMLDTLICAMHEEFGFGYDRIKKLEAVWSAKYNRYHTALEGTMESDVWQERLDAELLSVVQERQEFYPFADRFPDIRQPGYDRLPRR